MDLITRLRPVVVVKGKEFELRFNPELAILEKNNGEFIFSSGETIFSSVDFMHLIIRIQGKEFQELVQICVP